MDLTNALLKKGDEEFELGKAIDFIEDILAKQLTMV